MPLPEDITAEVTALLAQQWNIRDGTVVPESEAVALAGGGVRMKPTMLYADLADSTLLASKGDRHVAAKVLKAFLSVCCRVIRANGGYIRSFDGDRVMGVFLGDRQNSRAAASGLKINWAVNQVVRPQVEWAFPALAALGYRLNHTVGIDTSDTLVVRGGVRNNNDLIWIGRAPNVAAKLANIRDGDFTTYMTHDVFRIVSDAEKISHDGRAMWEGCTWTEAPTPEVATLHRSTWWMRP